MSSPNFCEKYENYKLIVLFDLTFWGTRPLKLALQVLSKFVGDNIPKSILLVFRGIDKPYFLWKIKQIISKL